MVGLFGRAGGGGVVISQGAVADAVGRCGLRSRSALIPPSPLFAQDSRRSGDIHPGG